ncbi:SCP2 sterol-binding domain-containing protein [Acerihabitans sp. TG2]|uniref:ubiquinone biosynthesis accessory factor UbiJ n=1 Tax=Acerihabitans sp. TG2 TaxID=3096008 RepID=UPI002B228FE9|nr:SCP2 sterol-binding domain-containing protein [Acerihabitans sp. TG2]MEA9389834.1 SCP2 sterol-binding domain-containing protein [Acerihabitans sp. TG2]
MLMLWVTAVLEAGLNRLLYQDSVMKPARQRLKGKVLRMELAELDSPLILVFGEMQVDVLTAWDAVADCTLKTHIATLPALRQRLTALIKQGDLDVEGDLQVVQQFAALLDMAEQDPAEILAPYLGDIVAEGLTQKVHAQFCGLRRRLLEHRARLGQAVSEEWRLCPSTLEIAWFSDEVDVIDRAGTRLAARLDKLEQSR